MLENSYHVSNHSGKRQRGCREVRELDFLDTSTPKAVTLKGSLQGHRPGQEQGWEMGFGIYFRGGEK